MRIMKSPNTVACTDFAMHTRTMPTLSTMVMVTKMTNSLRTSIHTRAHGMTATGVACQTTSDGAVARSIMEDVPIHHRLVSMPQTVLVGVVAAASTVENPQPLPQLAAVGVTAEFVVVVHMVVVGKAAVMNVLKRKPLLINGCKENLIVGTVMARGVVADQAEKEEEEEKL